MNFDHVQNVITKDEILKYVSEFDIFKKYCSNLRELDVSFCSDLRVDAHPTCRVFINDDNKLKYKDFADGFQMDCWYYVGRKFNCTYYETLNIIASDFKIRGNDVTLLPPPTLITANDEFKIKHINVPREKSVITIASQPWTITDYDYWQQFGISFELLEEYNVYSAKHVYLVKGGKRITFEYNKSNPCYAYRFTREGTYSYKIYWPLAKDKKFKWLFSGGAKDDIEGIDQLPLHGDLLVLTKSLKDIMCFKLCNLPAISLQGEGNILEQDLVDKLLKRFNKIIVNYDNDERGIIETNKLVRKYKFGCFYIDEYKDLSDYIKNKSLEEAQIMIYDKIRSF